MRPGLNSELNRGFKRAPLGMTLIELVVAMFILAIGTVAALGALDQSRRGIGQARTRLLAQIVVQNRAEELRLLSSVVISSLPSQVTMGKQEFTISSELRATAGNLLEVTLTARPDDGPGALIVVYLPPGGPNG
jgi:general secretion pathway protein I